jgi:hypothetical protein
MGEMMNTAPEIIKAFREGSITISECWNRLNGLRLAKSRPANEPEIVTPPSKVYEPLNSHELKAIAYLQGVSFGASRGAGRFAHQVKDAKELTGRQREYLRLLVFKYRRQIFGKKNADARAKEYVKEMSRDE